MTTTNDRGGPALSHWLARGRGLFYILAGLIVTLTTLAIGTTLMAGVVVRYFLGGSLAWGNELPVILFPWLIMGGVVMAAARHRHLGVDLVMRRLPPFAARTVMALIQLLIALLMGLLIQQSRGLLQFMQYQTTPVLSWPASWAFYSLPLGAAGVLLLAVMDLIGLLSGVEAPTEEASS